MKRKEQYADEIIEMLERTKCGAWASNINLNTKDRVIEVCQNCVDSWSGRKFKDHCTTSPQALEQTRWIPVSEGLPEDHDWYLVVMKEKDTGYQLIPRVATYMYDGKWDLIDSNGQCPEWLDNLECVAWMPLPQPYNGESEDKG